MFVLPGASADALNGCLDLLHDRMTQVAVVNAVPAAHQIFSRADPKPLQTVHLSGGDIDPKNALQEANCRWGLALADDEMDYLVSAYASSSESSLRRDPTDVELMMFGQVRFVYLILAHMICEFGALPPQDF